MADNPQTTTNANEKPEDGANNQQFSTTASQSEPAPPAELILLVQKVKTAATVDESRWTEANANLLLTTLNSLWMEAKGNGMWILFYLRRLLIL
jgi:hypothetical protein